MASESSSLPLVAVCGATGAQGGNVVRGLLAAGNVKIRGLTRNVESEKAQALKAQGVEMVSADFTNVDSLRGAFSGAQRVFILTNSFDPTAMGNEDGEIPLIKNIGDALASVGGIEYCVHSIFEDTRPLLDERPSVQGNWKVPHFDRKNEGNKYLRESSNLKVFTVNTGFYYENLISPMGGLSKGDDGVMTLAEPTSVQDKPFCLVSVVDIGLAAARLLADPSLGDRVAAEFNGGSQDFGLRPEWLSAGQVGEILNGIFDGEVRGVGQDYDE